MSKKYKQHHQEEQQPKYQKSLIPKTENQRKYYSSLQDYPITIGLGSAGSGKTYIAAYQAAWEYEHGSVDKIVLVRPAVTNESFGFLPGTLEEKLDPYMRPLFDCLEQRFGIKKLDSMIQSGEIELAPLAFMRGRTFNKSFVILDEAQNSTRDQMMMFLTRFGEGVKVAITGDLEQSDLRHDNGLEWAVRRLVNCSSVSTVRFYQDDVVRSHLVKELMRYLQ